jgi:hypothetical protein
MSMKSRFTARVIFASDTPKTKHFNGLPPQLTGGTDSRQLMESPALLVIEQKPDGVFLFRFTSDGRCVGDTWHNTIDAAKKQAAFEFDELLSVWKVVPDEVNDAVTFGLTTDT